ncbi:hypothetical protein QJS04_geneDACA016167 [Acorus gramineus]|uniref:RNase H type-1 domain-containing protein n=1 Tax=Acorus gramineus TaxID=55184 RepID=A0AAV9ANA7_ACOGR|nr:hypothetical protein QJS04_geneDACA016167 [Acorus gramineus]
MLAGHGALPICMEVEAIRLGVQFGRIKRLQRVVVCSDSEQLITLFKGSMGGLPALQQTAEAIRNCASDLNRIIFCKVDREGSGKLCEN